MLFHRDNWENKANVTTIQPGAQGCGVQIPGGKSHVDDVGFLVDKPLTQTGLSLSTRLLLLTIPAKWSVEVTHDLPVSRMFLHEHKLTGHDVVGETWRLGLNDGYVGTTWWCFGDLEGDLAGKHLSPWHEGMRVSPTPEVGEDWVLGLHPMELVFQDQSGDAQFQFVE